jgi:hypothetical protein
VDRLRTTGNRALDAEIDAMAAKVRDLEAAGRFLRSATDVTPPGAVHWTAGEVGSNPIPASGLEFDPADGFTVTADGGGVRVDLPTVTTGALSCLGAKVGRLEKDLTGDVLLTAAEAAHGIMEFGGTPGGACLVSLPAAADSAVFILFNNTGQNVTLKVTGGTGILVATGKRAVLYCDDTDVRRAGPDT